MTTNYVKINFVTSNKGKVNEFRQILEPEIEVNHIEIAYPEIRSESNEEIAKHSAKMLADKLKKPVVVEDSGLFIEALNWFPGTFSAYVHKRIGLTGILKLMKNVKNRNCFYRSAAAYCEPGRKPVGFLGEEKGIIAKKIRGTFGFGHDPIFIPKGSHKTYGEMKNYKEVKRFRRQAVEKLKEYLLKNRE